MATGTLSIAARNHHTFVITSALSTHAAFALAVLVALMVLIAVAKREILPWTVTDAEVTLSLFTLVL